MLGEEDKVTISEFWQWRDPGPTATSHAWHSINNLIQERAKEISFEHCVTVIVLQPATRGRSNRFGVTKFMLHQANSSESSSFNMAGNDQRDPV